MPYGLMLFRLRIRIILVSIPHMGCMPYGLIEGFDAEALCPSFNPSYGLHALRAQMLTGVCTISGVSIPHMGCMPYGRGPGRLLCETFEFQSLIWVACPTGNRMSMTS